VEAPNEVVGAEAGAEARGAEARGTALFVGGKGVSWPEYGCVAAGDDTLWKSLLGKFDAG
jgi:hypothetical protein